MKRAFLALLLFASLADGPRAQPARAQGMPEPIVRVTAEPQRVVVGQKITLQITVLAPNYMTSPPVLPDFQVRNAITRELQSLNLNEQHDGTSYAGVRFSYAIYPQEPGSYAVADQKLTLKYAADPPQTREVSLSLPRVDFHAFIPDAAASLAPFVAATKLTIEQNLQKSSDQLKVGGSVTRKITIRAEGVPAMLLPPAHFTTSDGLALYPAQPSLQDRTDQRTDQLSSLRVDSATYMLERADDYLLPAIDIGWWNVRDGKIERAHLDMVVLQVAENSDERSAPVQEPGSRLNWDAFMDFVVDHWRSLVLGIAGLVALAWFAPRIASCFAAAYRLRRAAYRASEAWSFVQLRNAIKRGDAEAAYLALLDWIARFGPGSGGAVLSSFEASAGDPVLQGQVECLERRLYGARHGPDDWSPRTLLKRITTARRRLRRRKFGYATRHALPAALNPDAPQIDGRARARPVAR